MTAYGYFVLFSITQLIHSQEEIWTGFHKKWFVFKMPRFIFITFEVVFSALFVTYLLKPDLSYASVFMQLFALIMLINGIGHIVWGFIEHKYVPGLITAPLFIVIFIFYYFNFMRI